MDSSDDESSSSLSSCSNSLRRELFKGRIPRDMDMNEPCLEGVEQSFPTSEDPEEQNYLKNLTSTEVGVLKCLSTPTILKVMNAVLGGSSLLDTLRNVSPGILQRIEKAEQEQYRVTVEKGENEETQYAESREMDIPSLQISLNTFIHSSDSENILNMSKVTPIRLGYEEQILLRLLGSALDVSEYTDKIDVIGKSRKKMIDEIRVIFAVLVGLLIAHDYDVGYRMIKDRSFKQNENFFRTVFELGRRYKILNPEKMRDTYGKLIHFLMDCRNPHIAEALEFDCVDEIVTVEKYLQDKKNGRNLLSDPLVKTATMTIMPGGLSQYQIESLKQQKEAAVKTLIRKYATAEKSGTVFRGLFNFLGRKRPNEEENSDSNLQELTSADIQQCLYSLGDHFTFLKFNKDPCDKMIEFLREYFKPDTYEKGFDLAIHSGRDGARLSHNHQKQYHFVLQSLMLWREILGEMLSLWLLADTDLLDKNNSYSLMDTGQGFNRVQNAYRVYRSMQNILSRVSKKTGCWHGSREIHLGDRNVPNALMFIDKYIQVPRILNPIILCLEEIPRIYKSAKHMKLYIDKGFGGPEKLIKIILTDFFRHAFDGSGADNFFEAGSCVDGRLTSAWNWCSRIEKKAYFPIFQLSNFTGFN